MRVTGSDQVRSPINATHAEWGDGLQIRPLEEAYKFGAFFSSLLNESDFSAKPSVLLLGQYSTGECSGYKAHPQNFNSQLTHETCDNKVLKSRSLCVHAPERVCAHKCTLLQSLNLVSCVPPVDASEVQCIFCLVAGLPKHSPVPTVSFWCRFGLAADRHCE